MIETTSAALSSERVRSLETASEIGITPTDSRVIATSSIRLERREEIANFVLDLLRLGHGLRHFLAQ
jgi:hypothetical protein